MITQIFYSQKAHFRNELKNSSIKVRLQKLRSIKKWIKKNESLIVNEIKKDFNKGQEEILLSEIKPVLDEINHAIEHLDSWMSPTKVATPLTFIGSSSKVIYEPKGVSLIIAPWNYPFNLCVGPLVSAISAGCTAVIKPSENTPFTSDLVKKMMSELFDEQEVSVQLGDYKVSESLLKLPFDHIFFTGSPQVGKIVMKSAAEHLTSVTLELGGRNPVIVDESANPKDAAQKIIWGKLLNAGQTCIAPNYVYAHESIKDKLTDFLIQEIKKQQNSDILESTHIVNPNHFNRINRLLETSKAEGVKIAFGGETDIDSNFISSTLLTNVTPNSTIFQEEIFGPLLPILSFNKIEETLEVINQTEKPLALYLFSKSRKAQEYIVKNSSAGTTCLNETTIHFAQPNLPFGGIGNSGMGKAHGKWGFLEFTNQRALLKQRTGFTATKTIFPPYTNLKKKLIRIITFWL